MMKKKVGALAGVIVVVRCIGSWRRHRKGRALELRKTHDHANDAAVMDRDVGGESAAAVPDLPLHIIQIIVNHLPLQTKVLLREEGHAFRNMFPECHIEWKIESFCKPAGGSWSHRNQMTKFLKFETEVHYPHFPDKLLPPSIITPLVTRILLAVEEDYKKGNDMRYVSYKNRSL